MNPEPEPVLFPLMGAQWAGLVLFLGGVGDPAHEQHAAGRLMVDNEDKRPVDGQPRRKSGERTGSASCGDIITALVNRHDRFLINLMM